MGLGLFSGSHKVISYSPTMIYSTVNPDPKNFTILEERFHNGYLILLVKYPDCTNYEGKKLMIYTGFNNSKELLEYNKGNLDPHFSKDKGAPIIRFKPDENSMELIEKLII
jgi:hypothetical protein